MKAKNNEDATPEDDFADEEEEEIVVLFKQNIGCDENEESEEEETSWSPSSLSDDENDDINDKSDSKTKPVPLTKLQPPELEEENGKTKVTEKFMKELIRYEWLYLWYAEISDIPVITDGAWKMVNLSFKFFQMLIQTRISSRISFFINTYLIF